MSAIKLISFLLVPVIYPIVSLSLAILGMIAMPRHLIYVLIATGLLFIDVKIAIAFVVLAVVHYAWSVFAAPKDYAHYLVWAANRPSNFLGKLSLVVFMAGLLIGIVLGMETLTFVSPIFRWFISLGIAYYVSTMAMAYLNVPHMIAQDQQLEDIFRKDR